MQKFAKDLEFYYSSTITFYSKWDSLHIDWLYKNCCRVLMITELHVARLSALTKEQESESLYTTHMKYKLLKLFSKADHSIFTL